MPVFIVNSDKQDVDPRSGKPYRHVNPACPGYTKHPDAERSGGVRNTHTVRERTVRCPLDGDWDVWEREQQLIADKRKARGSKSTSAGGGGGGGATSAAKAATTPAPQQGGKAGALASKARQARQQPRSGSDRAKKDDQAKAKA